MTSRIALVVIAAVTVPLIARAQVSPIPATPASQVSQPQVVLTLDEAITRGLAASHRLAEASARQQSADAIVAARRAAVVPRLDALAGYTRTNHVDEFGVPLPNNQLRVIYPDVPDNYRARLEAQWPLYTGGRLEALTRAAQLEATASADDAEALRADLRFEITRAYLGLVLSEQSLRVFEESLDRARSHVRDARNQLDAGLAPPSDLLSAQAQESRHRMFSIQARSARVSAEAELARLVGLAPDASITTSSSFEPIEPRPPLGVLVSQALAERRDRRALVSRLSSAASRQQASAAGKRPTVAVGGGFDYARPNSRIFPRAERWDDSWDASINVTWPLFDGGKTAAEAAEVAAVGRSIQARIDELDSLVALDIRQRLAELEAGQAAIDAADAAVQAATEAHRVLGERFRAGVATTTDVLAAQVAVTQALLDRTQALVNRSIVDARLRRTLGQ
jgi:outer membrane protein TolC